MCLYGSLVAINMIKYDKNHTKLSNILNMMNSVRSEIYRDETIAEAIGVIPTHSELLEVMDHGRRRKMYAERSIKDD